MVNIFGWMCSGKDVALLWASLGHRPLPVPFCNSLCCVWHWNSPAHTPCIQYIKKKKKKKKNNTEALSPFGRRHIWRVPRHLAVRWTSLPLSSIILITSMGKCLIHGDHSALPGSNLRPARSPSPWTQFHLFIFNPNPLSPTALQRVAVEWGPEFGHIVF